GVRVRGGGGGGGGGRSDAPRMDTAAVGVAQQEHRGQGIDEQNMVDRGSLCLPALTLRLFSSLLGAADAPRSPVMGPRGEAGAVAGRRAHGVACVAGGVRLRDAAALGAARERAGGGSAAA